MWEVAKGTNVGGNAPKAQGEHVVRNAALLHVQVLGAEREHSCCNLRIGRTRPSEHDGFSCDSGDTALLCGPPAIAHM